ncbi:alpha/beta hydrolase [Pseudonocardia sp. KRD-291]|nr:alpha/beta hydrolase [Pseudonocardia sp. KRD291]
MTHGAGADHHMFDGQYGALSRAGYRVVVWDMRAHGQSRPTDPDGPPFTADLALDDLSALVEHLGLDRPVLVGHSLGGNLSQETVRRRPDSASALVVLGSAWNAGPLSRTERIQLAMAAPALWTVPGRRLPAILARASATTEHGRQDTGRAFALLDKPTFIDVFRATTTLLAPSPGYRTPVPLCLVRGAEDYTGAIATSMPRWAAAEGVTEHVVPGAGHIVTVDASDAVIDVLLEFLEGLDSG